MLSAAPGSCPGDTAVLLQSTPQALIVLMVSISRTRLARTVRWCLLYAAPLFLAARSHAQPIPPMDAGITVTQVGTAAEAAVRLAFDPSGGALFYLTLGGDVYRLAPPFAGQEAERVYTTADHGLASAMGLAFGPEGTLFLVGNETNDSTNTGVIVRGTPAADGGRSWATVARTEAYPRSNTAFDHNFSGVAVSPDGAFLFVNSGSRTDHGEPQENDGRYPGVREVPLTSALFRLPADATDLFLQNDEAQLRAGGYLFADGLRNSFDLAFDADGRLFATENAGDRDDSEELNWLREGHHYGFPWRMGLAENPMQFAGYDPAADLLLNPAATAVQQGFFYDDPAFPPPPDGVAFTDPVHNLGPDADQYRDPATGAVLDAGHTGVPFATFTTHRSPLGLVFDTAGALPEPFRGDAFVLSWTGAESPLLAPFSGEGEDLLHLELEPQADGYAAHVVQLVHGFENPIDAALVDGRLYVLTFGGERALWEVSFDGGTAVEAEHPAAGFSLDVYPNPSAGPARIALRTAAAGAYVVALYDLLGRRVRLVHDGLLPAGGPHLFDLDAAELPAGPYVLRAGGPAGNTTRTFILLPSHP